jgi:hypothetical protein
MGAWAEDPFGNDTSCDWISTFLQTPGLDIVQEAINMVLAADEYLESDEACDCLAACEVVARLQGKWGLRNAYSEKLDLWIQANPISVPNDLKTAADLAIERILGADSELVEMWDEDGRNDKWHDSIDDLRERLKG